MAKRTLMKNCARIVIGSLVTIWALLVSFSTSAQVVGIRFEEGLNLQAVLAKAKQENKYIFLDCYTTWCGPCKWMSKNVFPLKEVGDAINEHFLSVAIQMDRTSKDSKTVKDLYEDADSIAKVYAVTGYPTYLFLDPSGTGVHYFVGSVENAEQFISIARDALDPGKQFFTTINKWDDHQQDSMFLLRSLKNTIAISDIGRANKIGDAYLKIISDSMTRVNIELLMQLALINQTSKSRWFSSLRSNAAKVNSTMRDSAYVQWNLGWGIIAAEEIDPIFVNHKFPIEWKEVCGNISTKYPDLGDTLLRLMKLQFKNDIATYVEQISSDSSSKQISWSSVEAIVRKNVKGFELDRILLEEKVAFYARTLQWERCSRWALVLMNKYGTALGSRTINNLCFDYVFLHCKERGVLKGALKWMKYDLDLAHNDPNKQDDFDTYANLLYKMGYKSDAVVWEKKAIESAQMNTISPHGLDALKLTLSKMECGSPTWNLD